MVWLEIMIAHYYFQMNANSNINTRRLYFPKSHGHSEDYAYYFPTKQIIDLRNMSCIPPKPPHVDWWRMLESMEFLSSQHCHSSCWYSVLVLIVATSNVIALLWGKEDILSHLASLITLASDHVQCLSPGNLFNSRWAFADGADCQHYVVKSRSGDIMIT